MTRRRSGISSRRATWSLLLLLAVLGFVGASCASECKQIRAEFEQLEKTQQKRSTRRMVQADAPEVLGVAIRASAIEKVVGEKLLSDTKPVTKTVGFGQGKLVSTIKILDLDLLPMGGCDECLRFSTSMELDVKVKAGPLSVVDTKGKAQLVARVPLLLESATTGSTLSADLARAKLEDVRVDVGELPKAARGPLNKLVTSAVQRALKSVGRRVQLVRWRPIKVDGSSVTLLASKLVLFPDEQAVWIGFKSNLTEPGEAVTPGARMKQGEDLSATFSGALMTALLRSMMKSGAIKDRLDSKLKPDPKGELRVRLHAIDPTPDGLTTRFSVWSLPEDDSACYVAQASGLTTARPHPKKRDKLKIEIQDIEVTETHGDDMLLDIGLWAKSVFMEETLAAQTSVLSAKTIEVGALGKVGLEVARVAHDDQSISVFSRVDFGAKPR